ncbi:MAG: acyltransferase [Acidobacteria bacterium]|nr:acyltransferase [Acidobacteriota bacterium]
MLKLDTDSKTREQRVPHLMQLDALRAFAVSGVLLQHFLPASIAIAPFGAMGVKLFFVLSGFLITGILLKCKEITDTTEQSIGFTLRRFYIRRFLRIFPLFYFVLLLAVIVNMAPARQTFFWHATYLSNVYITKTGNWPGALSPFWTLAVEEQFYLVWPWVILYTSRRHLLKVIFGVILLAPIFRLSIAVLGLNFSNWAVLPFACLDTLGLGALLALLSNKDFAQSRSRQIFLKIALYMGVPLLFVDLFLYYLKSGALWQFLTFDIVMGLSCVWLIATAAKGFTGIFGKILESKSLLYMGTISYGIYVYHSCIQGVLDGLLSLLKQRPMLVASIITTLVFVSLMSVIASKKLQRLLINAAIVKPLFYLGSSSLLLVLLIYAAMKRDLLSLPHMNTAIYFILSCTFAIAAAAISWEIFERPINNLKKRFPYRKESTDISKAF